MAQPFDAELEELVSKFSRDLADQIKSLILRRLGIERTAAAPARSSAVVRGARQQPQPPPSVRGGAKRAAPKAAAKGPVSERRGRSRPTNEERLAAIDRIARVVGNSGGLSVGEIERQSGLSRSVVGSALKSLKDQGRVFMGGTKRFARYATTQQAADQASLEARRGAAA